VIKVWKFFKSLPANITEVGKCGQARCIEFLNYTAGLIRSRCVMDT